MLGCRLQGKICFQLKDFVSSEGAYQRALKEHPKQLAAWKGLAELHTAAGNTAAAAAAFESLVSQKLKICKSLHFARYAQ